MGEYVPYRCISKNHMQKYDFFYRRDFYERIMYLRNRIIILHMIPMQSTPKLHLIKLEKAVWSRS